MATLVKIVEREFLLRTAMREKAPLIMAAGGSEWPVHILDLKAQSLTIAHNAPIALLRKGIGLDFRYNVRGQTIAFRTASLEPGDKTLVVAMPDKVYKNLSRRYARLPPPGDLTVSFAFAGERYDLDFPPSRVFTATEEHQLSPDFEPSDLRGLMAEFERKAAVLASDYGVVMYKDKTPEGPIEILASTTGRSFYLPAMMAGVPISDPFAERTILTRDDFLSYFIEEEGLEPDFSEDELIRLERARRNDGVLSELLVPILFQDYAIGYVTVINRQAGLPPFDLRVVEIFNGFSRALSWSLKLHGYFKGAPKLDESYRTEVEDVSAGGLLFACRDERLIQALKDGTSVTVRIGARRRTVNAAGNIRRHYAEATEGFFGIEFTAMEPEDFRFLFEYLYGRPFTDEDSESIEGVRILRP
ncbi:MAG: hypothetical protein E4H20_02855 [Spirochaetales bacterium]|nr:MAG: hypothetical protein E4H20_02855 [Spirochaetales bacterium]